MIGTHPREWHEARLDGIGASDAPVVVGLSPYKAPIELWREKVERIIPDEGETPLRLRLGNLIEPVVLDLYREATGRKVIRVRAEKRSKKWPFAFAHLDGKVQFERRIVQVKTAHPASLHRWGDPGEGPTKGVPPDIYVQELHELAVTGADVADVALLIGLHEFRIYEIPRDDEAIADLMAAEEEFFGWVRDRVEPPIDGTEAWARELRRRYPSEDQNAGIRPATPEEDQSILNLELLRHNAKMIDENVTEAENRLKAIIGTDAGIEGEHGRITWKAQTAKRVAWELVAKAYRALIEDIARKGEIVEMLGEMIGSEIQATLNDAIEGLYTTEQESRVFRVRFPKE